MESINRTLTSVPSASSNVLGRAGAAGLSTGFAAAGFPAGAAAADEAAPAAGCPGWTLLAVASSAESVEQAVKAKASAMMNIVYNRLFIDLLLLIGFVTW